MSIERKCKSSAAESTVVVQITAGGAVGAEVPK